MSLLKQQLPSVSQLEPLIEAALERCGGEASIQEIEEFVAAEAGLTAGQLTKRHREGQRRSELDYRLAWARTSLREKGRIERVERGIWRLSGVKSQKS